MPDSRHEDRWSKQAVRGVALFTALGVAVLVAIVIVVQVVLWAVRGLG